MEESCRNDLMNRTRRNRTSFTQAQLNILEEAFKANSYPGQEVRERIAAATELDEGKIQVWFSNRRARCRKSLAASCINSFVFYPHSPVPLLQDAVCLLSLQLTQ
ncbi:unnamed protein product [Gongylonema pulchrum]|uniref:Homeobox domain-containing protein n=1 Tax=Gongylonema pulchrum TaxID=637853 RepID=A0A183DFG3_9BILA|nr:unnamed protein product [Gongylonema pulchrum]